MRNMQIGLGLIVVGILALVLQNVSFTETKKVVDIGPLEITAEERHELPIPMIAGIAAGWLSQFGVRWYASRN